ncbi:MAG: serine/threonine-protein kinase [Duganella sp.]
MTTADAIIALELGPYRLREQIGSSAYGLIWRASAPHASGDVALKLINQQQMERALPAQRERWIASAANEISFLQSLEPWDERHIVRLLDSGWHAGLPVLALELLSTDLGKHMAALRAAGQRLPLARTLGWMAQLNQALAKVHQYGWRYLDLKPANVLLDAHLNTVKLADFGTNRQRASTQLHSYAGTANWQAPEQFFPVHDGGYATATASDYFSLGALFYFLVSGGIALRFCSDCGQAYRQHHTAGADLLRSRHGGAIPATLGDDEAARFAAALPPCARTPALALLRTLLQADPAQRPRHALDISRMLGVVANSVAHAMHGIDACAGDATALPDSAFETLGRPTASNNWRHFQEA